MQKKAHPGLCASPADAVVVGSASRIFLFMMIAARYSAGLRQSSIQQVYQLVSYADAFPNLILVSVREAPMQCLESGLSEESSWQNQAYQDCRGNGETSSAGSRTTRYRRPRFPVQDYPAGRRVFMLQYRTNAGERRKPALGQFGELTVEQARIMAQAWLAEVRHGGKTAPCVAISKRFKQAFGVWRVLQWLDAGAQGGKRAA